MQPEPPRNEPTRSIGSGPPAFDAAPERYVLTLFVSGMTRRSVEALASIKELCDEHLADCYDLEVVDIYLHPEAASFHQIVAVPTLLRSQPGPVRRLIGDLSDPMRVLRGLGLEGHA